jgi:hypothetical protein
VTVCPRVLSKNFSSQVIPNSLLPVVNPSIAGKTGLSIKSSLYLTNYEIHL